ncbi:hypothetical protein DWG96_19940 [Escherichia coli]|nr:hypothetical protein [Escherichia coli]
MRFFKRWSLQVNHEGARLWALLQTQHGSIRQMAEYNRQPLLRRGATRMTGGATHSSLPTTAEK